jgi:hypothetical protein
MYRNNNLIFLIESPDCPHFKRIIEIVFYILKVRVRLLSPLPVLVDAIQFFYILIISAGLFNLATIVMSFCLQTGFELILFSLSLRLKLS